MSNIWKETMEHHQKKIEEADNELNEIWKLIIDADVQGGIEKSCQVQDCFGPRIDILLDRKKFHEEQVRRLSAIMRELGE